MLPGSVAVLVLTTILAPLVVGIVVRTIAPAFADRAAKPVGIIASVLLLLSALPVLIGMARPMLSLIGDGTILSLGGFALAGLIVGHLLGGPEPGGRRVLALATASRHPAVALAIAHANFRAQKLAVGAVFLYVIQSVIFSALYLKWVKREEAVSGTAETNKPVEA
jgi:BASS family bile acid:Na+ symporter